jgi:hypothetical protein
VTTVNSGTDVIISWTAPYDNEDTITKYKIEIRAINGLDFYEDVLDCDGTNAIVIASL